MNNSAIDGVKFPTILKISKILMIKDWQRHKKSSLFKTSTEHPPSKQKELRQANQKNQRNKELIALQDDLHLLGEIQALEQDE